MGNTGDLLKNLQDNERYKVALALARNEGERRAVEQLVGSFVATIGELLAPALERARNDPKFAEELAGVLARGEEVLTSDPLVSGSKP